MSTFKYALVGAAMFATMSTTAGAFEDVGTIDLTEQGVALRVAQNASRETTKAIAALDAAYVGLRVDEPKAVEALLMAAWVAHDGAEADLRRARIQRELARLAVRQRLDQIRIEGAEEVEIGGEVRAARMVVAAWERLIETAIQNLAQARKEIARIDAERCRGCEVQDVATSAEE